MQVALVYGTCKYNMGHDSSDLKNKQLFRNYKNIFKNILYMKRCIHLPSLGEPDFELRISPGLVFLIKRNLKPNKFMLAQPCN